jgi:tetratricopeptide (TPR) repeat protein
LYLSRYVESKKDIYFKSAVKNFKKAVELDPRYASAYNGLGTVYVKANNIEAAIDCWEKALRINPEFSIAVYNLALAYLVKGDNTRALEFFNRYKKKHYERLTQEERDQFDAFVQKCQDDTESGDTACG